MHGVDSAWGGLLIVFPHSSDSSPGAWGRGNGLKGGSEPEEVSVVRLMVDCSSELPMSSSSSRSTACFLSLLSLLACLVRVLCSSVLFSFCVCLLADTISKMGFCLP